MRVRLTTIKAVLFGLGVALVGVALDVVTPLLFHRSRTAELVGDALTGMLAGYAMFRYMVYRLRLSQQRTTQIADLNHHIRNAMQAIVLSHQAGDDIQRLGIVREASDRIDQTLTRFTRHDQRFLDRLKETPAQRAKTAKAEG